MKNFIVFCSAARTSALQPEDGFERSRPMFALLIAFGALFLAVAVAAVIDPRAGRVDDLDDPTLLSA